jgi:hypothetical protein
MHLLQEGENGKDSDRDGSLSVKSLSNGEGDHDSQDHSNHCYEYAGNEVALVRSGMTMKDLNVTNDLPEIIDPTLMSARLDRS